MGGGGCIPGFNKFSDSILSFHQRYFMNQLAGSYQSFMHASLPSVLDPITTW